MAKLAKLLQAAAGAGGGGGLNIEDVFSTYLYTGNGSTQTITNGIDLSGEGGLVWTKQRTGAASSNVLVDTERGVNAVIYSDLTNAEYNTGTNTLTAFNNNGYDLGSNTNFNRNNEDNVSWTFRKAPKFFDVVTYTGDDTTSRQISHNLGCSPGAIIVKSLNTAQNWVVYHKDLDQDGATVDSNNLFLNTTGNQSGGGAFGDDQYQTSTYFTLGRLGSGFNDRFNKSGTTYVAYLFAHNDGDGEFGPDGDADIIKCGSYTGNGSTSGPEIDLGFEPQWLLVKNANSSSSDWLLLDVMRGWGMGDADIFIEPNTSGADQGSQNWVDITPTGFKITNSNGQINGSGNTHIYIAIRRGPMAVPESASDVFDIDTFGSTGDGKEPAFRSTFPVDMQIYKSTTGTSPVNTARLTQGKYLSTDTTDAENTGSWAQFDYQNGFYGGNTTTISHYYSWMWKRAPNYFDVVAYTGNGTAGNTISHNLGVAPEMIWIKNRVATSTWPVYHKDLGGTKFLPLNETSAALTESSVFNNTDPTDSVFTLGNAFSVNQSGSGHIAYLFASLDGVSKVGSYTGTGASGNQIDCGFSSGARFVLIKAASAGGHWAVYDTERGIVAGNDSKLRLNNTNAAITNVDSIDPYNSGFELADSSGDTNTSGVTYIFYAIA